MLLYLTNIWNIIPEILLKTSPYIIDNICDIFPIPFLVRNFLDLLWIDFIISPRPVFVNTIFKFLLF